MRSLWLQYPGSLINTPLSFFVISTPNKRRVLIYVWGHSTYVCNAREHNYIFPMNKAVCGWNRWRSEVSNSEYRPCSKQDNIGHVT